MRPQAIPGVTAGHETIIETVYPSIAASSVGRTIGSICDSIPMRIGGVKLSVLLFGPLMAPFALFGYLMFKVVNRRYIVTNRSVRVVAAIGEELKGQAALTEIDDIIINVQKGQAFYHAGDLVLLKSNGDELLTLPGVPRPERFRQVIMDARDARRYSDASLAAIDARQLQPA